MSGNIILNLKLLIVTSYTVLFSLAFTLLILQSIPKSSKHISLE